MPDTASISVIIPAGPGEKAWEGLVPCLDAFGEVILSHAAEDSPVTYDRCLTVSGPAGRARQLNAGARATSMPWLMFLHADSRPDERFVTAIRAAPEVEYIGFCALSYYDGPAWMRLNEFGSWIRSRLFGLPFGDQGMLMSRVVFERLGGFDEGISVGEDHAMVWAARHAGIPTLPLRAPLPTSARKYIEMGWGRTTGRHLMMTWNQIASWRRSR